MTATAEEVDDGEAETVDLQLLAAPTRLLQTDGKLSGMEFIKMRLGEPNASGRRRPIPEKGTESQLTCDTVIPAFGQAPDVSYFPTHVKGVKTSKWKTGVTNPWNFMTDRPGVFSGGDCQMGDKTVIECVAQGKLAARAMDAYLRGDDMDQIAKHLEAEERAGSHLDCSLQTGRAESQGAHAAVRRSRA